MLAYRNILKSTCPETFAEGEREKVYANHKRSVKSKIRTAFFCLLSCIVAMIMWALPLADWIKLLPFISFIIVIVFLLIREERFLKELYKTYGFTRQKPAKGSR
jgi:hypothetical protein